MNRLIAAVAFCCLAGPLQAQLVGLECRKSTETCCNEGKDARPWGGFNEGVAWEPALDAAKKRAALEGKAILLFQLVGDLNREGC